MSDANVYPGYGYGQSFHGHVPTFPHLHAGHNFANPASQSISNNTQTSSNSVRSTAPVVHSIEEAIQVVAGKEGEVPLAQSDSKKDIKGYVIESPIVGTFYSSSNPDADAFVSVGSKVKKGQVLCIIEAMKLMNEIESDVDGEVAEIFVNNEQGVEFGQPLFKIV